MVVTFCLFLYGFNRTRLIHTSIDRSDAENVIVDEVRFFVGGGTVAVNHSTRRELARGWDARLISERRKRYEVPTSQHSFQGPPDVPYAARKSWTNWLGFWHHYSGTGRSFGVHLWLPLSLSAGYLLVRWFISRTRLSKRGLCRKCGYDLRATPDRCPECGTPAEIDQDST